MQLLKVTWPLQDYYILDQVIKAHLEQIVFPRNTILSDHIVTQKPLSYLVSVTISLGIPVKD